MQADKWFWVPWVIAIIGGGAFGAVITAVVTKYRNRRQPVGISSERIEVFRQDPDTPFLQAAITLTTEEKDGIHSAIPITNLSIERITLVNNGNQDMPEFRFGITLQGDNHAIQVGAESADRHHTLTVVQELSLEKPQQTLDFILTPFNRGDEYTINVHFIYEEAAEVIQPSSAHPTRFVERRSGSKAGEEITPRLLLNSLTALTLLVFLILALFFIQAARDHFSAVREGYRKQREVIQPSSTNP